jgi:hypothetical protein
LRSGANGLELLQPGLNAQRYQGLFSGKVEKKKVESGELPMSKRCATTNIKGHEKEPTCSRKDATY